MKLLISDVGADGGYGNATVTHMTASAAALTELAQLVSTEPSEPDTRPIHVRLSHFEHGGFLSLLLYGFGILPASGEFVIRPTPPGMKDKPPPPAAALLSPKATSPEHPIIYAVVANHSVAVQIEHTLATLASLLARQELITEHRVDVSEMDHLASDADARALTTIRDSLRSQGWRAAAEEIGARCRAAGLPLAVTYNSVLMDREAIALRAPILRRVYNEMEPVRESVDKIATMLSQGFRATGTGSARLMAFARDMLDLGSNRTYLAHLARDAFVCGNGYLSFGAVPDEDIRLLPPELVTVLDSETVSVKLENKDVIYRNVLHAKGAEQVDSPYGLSALEPFVRYQSDREGMQFMLDIAAAWDRIEAPKEHRLAAARNVPLARRTLVSLDRRIVATLGGARTLRVQPPTDLYFPGYEYMSPAADGLAMKD